MERFVRLLLLTGLVLSTIGALAYAIRIVLGQIMGVSWYWAGAFVAYLGPLVFAAAMYFNELRLRTAKQIGTSADA